MLFTLLRLGKETETRRIEYTREQGTSRQNASQRWKTTHTTQQNNNRSDNAHQFLAISHYMAVIARLFIPFARREHFNCLWLATIIKWSEKKCLVSRLFVRFAHFIFLIRANGLRCFHCALRLFCAPTIRQSVLAWAAKCCSNICHIQMGLANFGLEVVLARLSIQLFCIAIQPSALFHNSFFIFVRFLCFTFRSASFHFFLTLLIWLNNRINRENVCLSVLYWLQVSRSPLEWFVSVQHICATITRESQYLFGCVFAASCFFLKQSALCDKHLSA